MDFDLPDSAFLYADSNRGIYIPQYFAESVIRDAVKGVTESQWVVLESGPDAEWYWDTWDSVLNNARLTKESTGRVYVLWQDGDLWCVPADWTPCDDSENDESED
jgi:hypothetical protein